MTKPMEYTVETTAANSYSPWGVYESISGSAAKILVCQSLERETAERIARLLWAEKLIDLLVTQVGHLPELP